MRLHALVGPSFWRDDMPFRWQTSASLADSSDWEMVRYLTVLADFEHKHHALDEAASVQTAKLDLTLLWMARLLPAQMPPAGEVMMGLESVTWISMHAIAEQQTGQVQFCLSQQFPLLLQLPVQVTSCRECGGAYQMTARWTGLSEELLDLLEKTVFRYHRRQISSLRESQC